MLSVASGRRLLSESRWSKRRSRWTTTSGNVAPDGSHVEHLSLPLPPFRARIDRAASSISDFVVAVARIASRALFLSALSAARERIREDLPGERMENETRALRGPTDVRREAVLSGPRRFIVPLRMKASYFSFPRSSYLSTRPSTAPLHISPPRSPFLSYRGNGSATINLCPTACSAVFPSSPFYLSILNLAEKIPSP